MDLTYYGMPGHRQFWAGQRPKGADYPGCRLAPKGADYPGQDRLGNKSAGGPDVSHPRQQDVYPSSVCPASCPLSGPSPLLPKVHSNALFSFPGRPRTG